MSSLNPFLRWAGSKRQILPTLAKFWNDGHQRYLEPFAGSACLFFRLAPSRAILGDINGDLIATYLAVKYRLKNGFNVLIARPSEADCFFIDLAIFYHRQPERTHR